MQSRRQLADKWYNNVLLAKHIATYSLVLFLALFFYPRVDLDVSKIISYVFLITNYHIISDLISSWEVQRAIVIGAHERKVWLVILDQLLHLSVLLYFSHLLY